MERNEFTTFRCKMDKNVNIVKNENIRIATMNDLEKLQPIINEEDLKDETKIILIYEKNDIKEVLCTGMVNKNEIQIFFRPKIKNKNIQKQLIRELQRIGLERNITNFCTFEIDNDEDRKRVLINLGFKV